MYLKKTIITFLLAICSLSAMADNIKLYFFVATSCPISQKYANEINRLYEVYASRNIDMILVFPTKQKNKKAVELFCNTYQLKMPYLIDHKLILTNQLNATITPEVFLVAENKKIIYYGAIDNWFYALGKNRIHITAHYLEDAIKATLNKEKIENPYVAAVGCFIQ